MAKKEATDDGLRQLKEAIRTKNIGRLYFFHGEESFLLSHYLESVKKALLDPLTESFNFHRFSAEEFDITAFQDAVENLPMMADYTLIQIDDVDLFRLNESDRDKVCTIIKDIPEYCTVVFTYLTTPWKPDKRLKKIWEPIDQKGLIVEFAKQELKELIPWVSRHFASRKKRISNQLCTYLIEITGGTMTALNGEIDKICAFSGAEEICKADIDAVTEPVLDAVVFQMTDQVNTGNYEQAFQSLQSLLQLQQEPISILGALGAHFRRLYAAKVLMESGKNSFDFQKMYGIHEYVAKKAFEAVRYMDISFCGFAIERIIETDYQMKTSFDDNDRLLEILVLQLASWKRK